MTTDTTKLTIRLPRKDVEFAKAFAKAHGITVTEVIDRYLRRMRELDQRSPSSEVTAISGLVPEEVDAVEEHHRHMLEKQGR